jgi:hypothetical protein
LGLLGSPSLGVALRFERKLLLGVVPVFGGDQTLGLSRQVIAVTARGQVLEVGSARGVELKCPPDRGPALFGVGRENSPVNPYRQRQTVPDR